MPIDIVAIIVGVLLLIKGYQRGILVALGASLAFILGLVFAFSFSARGSVYLLDRGWASASWAPVLSFVILFFGLVWICRYLIKLLEGLLSGVMLGWVNRGLGAILYLSIGAVALSTFLWLANSAHLISTDTLFQSKSYPYLKPIAPWVFEHIGALIPFIKESLQDLKHFFEQVNQKLPEHVGTVR